MRKITANTLRIIAICFVGAGLSPAQTSNPTAPPHGLVTLNLTWSRELSRLNSDGAPRAEIPGPKRRDNPYDNPADKLRTPSPVPKSPAPQTGESPYYYVYALKVRNDGVKKVRGVYWEYVAKDTVSGAELSRRPFVSEQNIGPGHVATLRAELLSPPTNRVTAGGLGKDAHSPFTDSAEIRCVIYDDAKVWGADGSEKECAELRQADALKHGRKGARP